MDISTIRVVPVCVPLPPSPLLPLGQHLFRLPDRQILCLHTWTVVSHQQVRGACRQTSMPELVRRAVLESSGQGHILTLVVDHAVVVLPMQKTHPDVGPILAVPCAMSMHHRLETRSRICTVFAAWRAGVPAPYAEDVENGDAGGPTGSPG